MLEPKRRKTDMRSKLRRHLRPVIGEHDARRVLTENLDELHRLAANLLEYETLTGEEAKRAIRGEDIGRGDADRSRVPAVTGTQIPSTRRPRGGIGGPATQGA
jgi:cell division protease FtsH